MNPYGWEVSAEFCDRLFYIPGAERNWISKYHYRGSKSQAIMRVKMKPHFQQIVNVEPVSKEDWIRAYGEGRM